MAKPGPKPGRNGYYMREEEYTTTYQLEYIRCGKPNCSTCSAGQGHGPYWYAYHFSPGAKRRIKKYIGKQRPPGADPAGDLHTTNQAEDDQADAIQATHTRQPTTPAGRPAEAPATQPDVV